jgi:hypothetical protein
MGLGAGFKLVDKDREKARDDDKDDKPSAEFKEKERWEDDDNIHEKVASGWTQMVEDWLCHGGSSIRAVSPSTAEISTPRPLLKQKSIREPRRGPYQLLIKDRLMGIYLALYIHRDLKPLVQGVALGILSRSNNLRGLGSSKASVTTGLIGGRLGNKGGVGISLKLDGRTFLFLNAHLAGQILCFSKLCVLIIFFWK